MYNKTSGSAVIFLVLYVDDILFIGNNVSVLQSVKILLSKNFSMKDLGKATYILRINVKPRKIRNFQKWQNDNNNNNCHNDLGKPIKFSRSWMTKRTVPLNSSCEI